MSTETEKGNAKGFVAIPDGKGGWIGKLLNMGQNHQLHAHERISTDLAGKGVAENGKFNFNNFHVEEMVGQIEQDLNTHRDLEF